MYLPKCGHFSLMAYTRLWYLKTAICCSLHDTKAPVLLFCLLKPGLKETALGITWNFSSDLDQSKRSEIQYIYDTLIVTFGVQVYETV